MAEIIPDKLPAGSSVGEKKLFSILQKLPDYYIVYYEPVVEDQYPDFIVICPDMGILTIEVKGWYPKDLLDANSNSIRVKESKTEIVRNHPDKQADDYIQSLIDRCKSHNSGKHLLQFEGEHQNKFIFPSGHLIILSNINDTQLKEHQRGDFTKIFSPSNVVTRDILESWTDENLTSNDLCKIIKPYFNPSKEFFCLSSKQVDTLRAIIHPEIELVSHSSQSKQPEIVQSSVVETPDVVPDIKVLDLRQENNARNIGDGHRIIYGVAGSGKTVLLIAKARLLSSQKHDTQILMLCYNVTLATYLSNAVRDCKNVIVKHFDGWAKANGCPRLQGEQNEELGYRFLQTLENGCSDTRRYDTILIDEAQDFSDSWFKCVLEAMQEPNDGDLIIVGDGNQSLYRKTKVPWSSIGIQAKGRTIYTKFDLDKNYRNSREIVELAAVFSTPTAQSEQTENTILSLFVDPEKCQRRTGIKPAFVKVDNRRAECTQVLSIVKNVLNGKWFGKDIAPLKPEEIGILYPFASYNDKPILKEMLESLSQLSTVIWLNDPDNFRAKTKINDPGIKIQTIHSAKGLQYRAVILMWADHLPRQFGDTTEIQERCLTYIAITRPEDYLVITASASSPFISEIIKSGKVDLI